MVSAQEEFPAVRVVTECPEGLVCMRLVDRMAIVLWLDQDARIHDSLSACPNVEIKAIPAPTPEAHVSP